jgi:hypothetical protein
VNRRVLTLFAGKSAISRHFDTLTATNPNWSGGLEVPSSNLGALIVRNYLQNALKRMGWRRRAGRAPHPRLDSSDRSFADTGQAERDARADEVKSRVQASEERQEQRPQH